MNSLQKIAYEESDKAVNSDGSNSEGDFLLKAGTNLLRNEKQKAINYKTYTQSNSGRNAMDGNAQEYDYIETDHSECCTIMKSHLLRHCILLLFLPLLICLPQKGDNTKFIEVSLFFEIFSMNAIWRSLLDKGQHMVFMDDVKEKEESKEDEKIDKKTTSRPESEARRRKLYDRGIKTDEPERNAAANKNNRFNKIDKSSLECNSDTATYVNDETSSDNNSSKTTSHTNYRCLYEKTTNCLQSMGIGKARKNNKTE
ncbi:unnamed protein product [Onchocerca flexuosa]|uniref:Uncharacterized protein n=1 Tax=Onchocerca flexuosa TaxID=387005 RepID=A0A183H9S4_9BILA|nr:unnamed protein product [Onchocerca flexuosa]